MDLLLCPDALLLGEGVTVELREELTVPLTVPVAVETLVRVPVAQWDGLGLAVMERVPVEQGVGDMDSMPVVETVGVTVAVAVLLQQREVVLEGPMVRVGEDVTELVIETDTLPISVPTLL
jgi:hypothetical protein